MQKFSSFGRKKKNRPKFDIEWLCSKVFICSKLKAFLMANLFFGGAYFRREFCISKWVGLDNKDGSKHKDNSLNQLTRTVHGLIFGGAYCDHRNLTAFHCQ